MFAKVILPVPLFQTFDYSVPKELITVKKGMRVLVPFGRRKLIGIVESIHTKSNYPLEQIKPILAIIDQEPILSEKEFSWCYWLSQYYFSPIGEVYSTIIPNLLKKDTPATTGKRQPKKKTTTIELHEVMPHLNPAQEKAVNTVSATLNNFQPLLLQGVTASGKTEVYLQIIANVLAQGKQALVLVPEIGLTPQTIARFEKRFGNICHVLHSNITDRQRLDSWLAAKAGKASIIIGTRSAIFTLFPNLGIIIIDEEHDLSYKQQDGLRYSARDFAVFRAQQEKIPVVLASATPSLESLYNVETGRYQLLELPHRAGIASKPRFELVDMRQQTLKADLSPNLLSKISQKLSNGEQVLLFLNRRGYSPMLMCHHCGWHAQCDRCEKPFTCHQSIKQLICHHCERQRPIPKQCPTCQQNTILFIGSGTERIEEFLTEQFKDYPVIRIDRDTTRRKQAMHDFVTQIHSGKPQILLGTQMLAKGHHFPHVTLVGILDSDQGLFSSDFRALERLGQLITQVAGRAGRAEKPGEVIIQTYQPEHPLLNLLLRDGYPTFAKTLLQDRKECYLPPYVYFTLWRAQANNKNLVEEFLQAAKEIALSLNAEKNLQILGPIPAIMEKKAGQFHFQLLLQSNKRSTLHQINQKILEKILTLPISKKVRWSIDVDPQEMN